MSTYGTGNTGSGGGGFPSGDPYKGPAGGGPVFTPPTPRAAPAEGEAPDNFNGPGAIDFNLMEPIGSVQEGVDTSKDVFTGLKAFLFGTDAPDAKGEHGGLPVLGWGPIGAAARFGSEVAVNLSAGLIKGAVETGINVLERTASTDLPELEKMRERFNALPEDSAARQHAEEMIAADKGFMDSGGFTAHDHYMAEAIQRYEQEEMVSENPDLWAGAFRPNASLMDTVTNMFGALSVPVKPLAEAWAGLGTPGQGGMNRVQTIMAVGDGHASFAEDKGLAGTGILAGDPTTGLNAVEQVVYDNISNGTWDEDDAQVFLASRGAAFSHSAAANIAGEVALDPLNLATLGAGAVAKAGATGLKLVRAIDNTERMLRTAKLATQGRKSLTTAERAIRMERVNTLEKSLEALKTGGLRTGARLESTGSRDVLGRIAGADATGDAFRAIGKAYAGLEGTGFGRAAKIARTVIDPLHAVGANPKAAAALDAGSRDVTRAVALAHGELNHISNTRYLTDNLTPEVADQYLQGLAIYSGNVLRRVAGRSYRASQMMMSDKGEKLIKTMPSLSMQAALKGLKKAGLTQLEEEVTKHIQQVWTVQDDLELGRRMELLWGGRTADEWAPDLAKMTAEQKALLHASTYGSAVQQLHKAKMATKLAGETGWDADKLERLILIRRGTLTNVGHEGIMNRLAAAADDVARMAIIRTEKHTYAELRSFVVDDTSDAVTISNFMEMMERIKPRLPHQVMDAERANMTSAMREFDNLITPSKNPDEAIYTIGFRPKDEYLWGLERDSDGMLREVTDPWMDQSSDIAGAYSPVREVPRNIAGQPIIGAVAAKSAKALDHAEAVGRMALHGVTGKMVTNLARGKFVEKVGAKYVLDDGTPALTTEQVESIWKALMDKVEDSENISGVRGLSEGAIWKAVTKAGVIPRYAERAGMDSRQLLVDILDAYDGNIRMIGLTQKMSGRVKKMMGNTFMGNTAGMIAEHAWPLLKFRLNPFFQLQEKIEPWVLNAQRGASVALGTKANALDKQAMDVYHNFADRGLIHIADNDIAELSARFTMGKRLNALAYGENAPLRGWASKLEGMTDIQGTKQLNMMRTWRKNLGKNMRAEWDATHPGEFDRMLANHRSLVGEIVDEDDFAVAMAHSNLAANKVFIKNIDGVPHMDFTAAMMEGVWSAPQHLGEMRPLNMEHMVQRLALRDTAGNDLETVMDMRRALADGRITHDDIQRELRSIQAHPDYRKRFESALRFSWPEFWSEVKVAYSMDPDEVKRLENMFVNIARNRDMTPTEYLSQVYAPHVARGNEGSIGSLGALVENMRAGGRVELLPDLAQLRGIAGQSQVRDFYQQMGAVFANHLDPSAKRNLMVEMMGDQNTPDDIGRILEVWDSENMTEVLMDRIMNYVHGTPGSGPHTVVADEATGVAGIRDAAARIRERQGRPRTTTRYIMDDDEELGRRVAATWEGMPEGVHIATPSELEVRAAVADMDARATASGYFPPHARPDATGLPTFARRGYTKQALETRALYREITAPTSQGGMGIKVTLTKTQKPYADADALRADLARGRIKVPRDGYWHPQLDTTDLAMQRVVRDVFGYGQEKNAFGSHDSLASAAAMYSDEARPTYIADEWGAAAYERYSDKVIEQAVAEPTTRAEYEARWGRASYERVQQADPDVGGAAGPDFHSRSVGDGVLAMDEAGQRELFTALGVIRNQFPGVPMGRIDIADLSDLGVDERGRKLAAGGITMVYPQEDATIVLSSHQGFHADPAKRAEQAARMAEVRRVNSAAHPGEPVWTVSATPLGILYHEFGHAVDSMLHFGGEAEFGLVATSQYADEALTIFMDEFRDSGAAARLSKYGGEANDHAVMTDSEGFGELFDAAFNPEHSERLMNGEFGDLEEWVVAFRQHMKRLNIWKPDGAPVRVNPHAGKTIAEANAAGAGIRAPRRIGPMPEDVMNDLAERFMGNGRFHEANPDVARTAAYMRDFMTQATADTLDAGSAAQYAHVFDQLSGMPVNDAVPFNLTEAAMWHGQAQMMAAKWQDAFRLQYFAQNRSMLQRSINHPMFGLYPASYMWGKVGPEMVKFMALEPFGAKTGLALYTLMDLQKAVAVQREFDPEFDKKIEDLGHSAALSWLGYMVPATPWSVPSSYPAWMRDMANQGQKNIAAVEAGEEVEDNNFIDPLKASLKKVMPMTTQLPFFERAVDEVSGGLAWNQEEEEAPLPTAGPDGMPLAPIPESGGAPAAVGAPAGPDLSGTVTATESENILAGVMDSLSAMFRE